MTQAQTDAEPLTPEKRDKFSNRDGRLGEKPSITPHPIVFFDGDCVMCNGFVDLMLRLDPSGKILLSPLQGETAKQYLPPLPPKREEWTIYYWDESGLYARSEAVVRICQRLNNWISMFSIAAWIPLFLRDGVYNLIARNRYNLFGKRETCRVPPSTKQDRFLP